MSDIPDSVVQVLLAQLIANIDEPARGKQARQLVPRTPVEPITDSGDEGRRPYRSLDARVRGSSP